jgi:hypothetical protein
MDSVKDSQEFNQEPSWEQLEFRVFSSSYPIHPMIQRRVMRLRTMKSLTTAIN